MNYFCISYLIERDVCYLVLCEKNFSKRSAFSFLEDIAAEFNRIYGRQVSTVSRPYTLIEFGNYFILYILIYIRVDTRSMINISSPIIF